MGIPSSSRRIIGPSRVAFTRAQHGDVGWWHVAVEQFRDSVDGCFQRVVADQGLDLVVERGSPGARLDGLVDTTPVVRQQRGRGVDHVRPAAIVDLQVMGGRTRKQVGEIDQPGRRGSGVAVDGLVVVAHSEDVRGRTGKQADQQDVGGGSGLGTRLRAAPRRPV